MASGRRWALPALLLLLVSLKAIAGTSVQTCADGVSQCPAGGSCCALADGHYGCCATSSGVCCAGSATCCPSGYTCHATDGSCLANNVTAHPYQPWTPQWNLCEGPLPVYRLPKVVDDLNFLYYSSRGHIETPQTETDPEMAVIVVHGASRNADEYFCTMLKAAQLQTSIDPHRVHVIAPWFTEPQDGVASDVVVWNGSDPNGPWRAGLQSLPSPQNHTISSYAILDRLVDTFANRTLFPSLRQIAILGHSSGGQTVQRYAFSHAFAQSTVPVRFVVANPSSYVYLDGRRWNANGTKLATPSSDQQQACPSYNAWEWGLGSDLPPYLERASGIDSLISRYPQLDVAYLAGQNDTCNEDREPGCTSHGLEKTCADMFEGWMRLNRAQQYFAYLRAYFGKEVHSFHAIPNAAHDHTLIFESPIALSLVFALPDVPSTTSGPSDKHPSNRNGMYIGVGLVGLVAIFAGVAVWRWSHSRRLGRRVSIDDARGPYTPLNAPLNEDDDMFGR
ncbi:uncharacterized protein MONBRDRAFT_11382 [Monosiga brevicollis MX1]|uniref:Granulins domain-containing protein n=1 Tax=Monosiga brevicollis TaxID=81824 RepID=A9V933_MONBE|nr:uncharacterized protein MONBRDRAFT_11382 [Monosiga brevicollis MX1]EDQ85984.1 predicted protein [Monosiga brevicollis MX1]|eukprot:XP_001749178.1 hypothetical protein [Monosiga brevicollis MX1]